MFLKQLYYEINIDLDSIISSVDLSVTNFKNNFLYCKRNKTF